MMLASKYLVLEKNVQKFAEIIVQNSMRYFRKASSFFLLIEKQQKKIGKYQ